MQEESSSYLQFARIPDEDDTRKILLQMGNQSVHVSVFFTFQCALLFRHIGQQWIGWRVITGSRVQKIRTANPIEALDQTPERRYVKPINCLA